MVNEQEMTAENLLLQLNSLDEVSRVEAKEGQKIDKSIRETICAFCNEPSLGGGYLILGLKRGKTLFDVQYEVVGVDDPDQVQCDLATQCSNEFSTVIRPDIHVEELDRKKIVWAYIPEMPPGEKPVTIKSNGRAYRRIGSTDHKCSQDDFHYLYQLREGRSYDETLIHDGNMQDFNPDAITEYRRLRGKANAAAWELTATDEDLLRGLHCLAYENDIPKPTVAGIQLFGTQAALRRCFAMARIDYIRITGTQWVEDPEKRFDTVEIRDPLFTAIRRTEAAILDDLPKAFNLPKGELERRDVPLLPTGVIREAVVNAVMHRSYRTHSPIQIIRYSNRLEIRNPGHSLKPEDQLGEPGSNPRNPAIAAVLHEIHMAETKGSGIKVMRDLMNQVNLEPPTFKSSRASDEFTAVFLFHHFLSEENLQWLNRLSSFNLPQEDQKALVYVREMGIIDNASYRDINQVDTLTASGHLRNLRDQGLLEKQGKGFKTFYLPGPKFPKPDNLEAKPDNLEAKPDNLETEPDELLEAPELLSQMPKKLRDMALHVGKKAPKENIRHAILALCQWKEMTVTQLAGILRRNRTFLLGEHIKQMVDTDELQMKYPQENHPHQAYQAKITRGNT
ncbi:MAG: putative DNA binding domain-containing protein [Phycisphaerae bacterium]|nr:putative DNA binding domain-containing protein [Phycisphaerae bacterium]